MLGGGPPRTSARGRRARACRQILGVTRCARRRHMPRKWGPIIMLRLGCICSCWRARARGCGRARIRTAASRCCPGRMSVSAATHARSALSLSLPLSLAFSLCVAVSRSFLIPLSVVDFGDQVLPCAGPCVCVCVCVCACGCVPGRTGRREWVSARQSMRLRAHKACLCLCLCPYLRLCVCAAHRCRTARG